MANPPSKPDPGLIAAIVAIGSVSMLIMLTVLGLFATLPPWVSVLIVVLELTIPFIVYWMLRRRSNQ
jgi:Flp pilus assembly protein TadB